MLLMMMMMNSDDDDDDDECDDDDDDSDDGDGDEGGILPQTSCQGGERQDQRLSDRQIRHPSSLISLSLIFYTLYFILVTTFPFVSIPLDLA